MTVIKLLMLLAVAIVGYCYADWDNPSGWPYSHWSPFLAPAWDVDGLFVGASVCFFAYTGGKGAGLGRGRRGWGGRAGGAAAKRRLPVCPPNKRAAAGGRRAESCPSNLGRRPVLPLTVLPPTAGFDAIGNAAEEVSSWKRAATRVAV